MKKKEKIAIIICILIISTITILLGIRKTDYYIDEVWTYGLANHIGSTQPVIEFGKQYFEMGPYEDFVEVKNGERFNYINVWQNQANDVHPPLYYIFVHTICSMFPNTFSKWYGIAVNMFWMVGITILLYKLAKEITKSTIIAMGIVLTYETSVIFFNTLLFIRMYTQLTFFTIAITYLIKLYWDSQLDRRFYLSFSALVILGMLTHYYFMIYTFFISVIFAIHMIGKKRFKELMRCIMTAIISGVLYLLLWYHFAGHLFRNYRGRQALRAAVNFSDAYKRIAGMFEIISDEAFAGLLLVIIAIWGVTVVIRLVKKEHVFDFGNCAFISSLCYVLVVGKIAPFIHDRYMMPAIFPFFIMSCTCICEIVMFFTKKETVIYVAIAALLLINVYNLANDGFYVQMDYHSEKQNELVETLRDNDCVVYIDDLWEALYYFVPLQQAKSYTFVNKNNFSTVLKEMDDDYVLIVKESAKEALIDDQTAEKLYTEAGNGYYLISP